MTPIQDAHRIFSAALEEYDPTHVFLLTSGGNDSAVPLHLFRDHSRITAAVHIDTGIKIPDVEPNVRSTCDLFGVPLLVYRAHENTRADGTPDPMIYEQIVKQHGFPGPAQHNIMYSKLKERQIRRLVRDHHPGPTMLVTGVRRSESNRRMGTVKETHRDGNQIWVAPIIHWNDQDMLTYRKHHNLPESPVASKLGMSGECLCGAFAKPGELNRIRQHYPDVAARIRNLERKASCPWGWESGPDHQWSELQRGQGTLGFTPLCTSCVSRGRA